MQRSQTLSQEEAIEFLIATLKHWKALGTDDPASLRKFAQATYEYLITASTSPQELLRRLETLQKEKRRPVIDLDKAVILYYERDRRKNE